MNEHKDDLIITRRRSTADQHQRHLASLDILGQGDAIIMNSNGDDKNNKDNNSNNNNNNNDINNNDD